MYRPESGQRSGGLPTLEMYSCSLAQRAYCNRQMFSSSTSERPVGSEEPSGISSACAPGLAGADLFCGATRDTFEFVARWLVVGAELPETPKSFECCGVCCYVSAGTSDTATANHSNTTRPNPLFVFEVTFLKMMDKKVTLPETTAGQGDFIDWQRRNMWRNRRHRDTNGRQAHHVS